MQNCITGRNYDLDETEKKKTHLPEVGFHLSDGVFQAKNYRFPLRFAKTGGNKR